MARLRLWQNTRVAELTSGAATLAGGTLGFEWDEDVDNGARPIGLVHLSSTTLDGAEKLLDYGATVGLGAVTHALTLYRHPSGALVFGAGTVQWSCASPVSGGQVQSQKRLTITGTATDSGGAVAGVEVSTDGGTTWHLAGGGAAWSYEWAPGTIGSARFAAARSMTAATSSRDCRVNRRGKMPVQQQQLMGLVGGASPSQLPRYEPGRNRREVHERGPRLHHRRAVLQGPGEHRHASGQSVDHRRQRLATAVFAAETATGWQQVSFDSPVPIDANTTYVASYHSNAGA